MNSAALALKLDNNKQRQAAFSIQPSVLTDIYQDHINLAVWQNAISAEVEQEIATIIQDLSYLKAVMTVTPENTAVSLAEHTTELADKPAFCQHIATLVDMFCTLFELKRVGLCINFIDSAMCPKFHVDHVPCRLVTTLSGIATEWLPHEKVNRSKLGAGSAGKPDEHSGIMQSTNDIQHLTTGDVALLKGEGWYGNEQAGLVHRSPTPNEGQHRLVMTLDFID